MEPPSTDATSSSWKTSVYRPLKYVGLRLFRLIARYPKLIAVFGFVSGLASFFLVEREQERFAQIVSLIMLASWAWLTLENLLRDGIARVFGLRMPEPLLKFVTQLVHQETLFFAIPFFVITATWSSPQAIFVCLLFIMAAISIIDPIYYAWLARRRWLYFLYHGFTMFTALLVALPIIAHIPTAKAYVWSLGIAITLAFLNALKELPYRHWQRAIIGAVIVIGASIVGTLFRGWVPPANLWLTEIAIAESVDEERRAPTAKLTRVSERQLLRGIYAYTSVYAPRGLKEQIYHAWYFEGQLVDRIPLKISGGRDEGYRVWTHKRKFPSNPAGSWRIDVTTEASQLIGTMRFSVMYDDERDSAELSAGNDDETLFTASPGRPFIHFVIDEMKELLRASSLEWIPANGEDRPN